MSVITSNQDLIALCDRLARAEFITVDTEFMRDKTYWPVLCLIQVASPDEAWAIDPMAPDIDLAPFYDVMKNENVLKVFHSGRQDLEIFFHDMGGFPKPLFDTQVAAMVCGFGDSVGYETLVHRFTDAKLDKSSRFTDWARRPLTERQISYALSDVTHMRPIYRALAQQLEESGRRSWLDEEIGALTDPSTYITVPDEAWRRLKLRSTNRRYLGILKCLAAWRQREAELRDLPRNRILRDEALLEIAAHPPKSRDDLKGMRSLSRGFPENSLVKGLLEAVQDGQNLPDSELPKVQKPKHTPAGTGPLVELLKVLLKMKCADHGVAQKLLASSSELEAVAMNLPEADHLMRGWRWDIFGKDAVALREGKIALSAQRGKITIVPLEQD
ncbi:MAG TPA: ribonuclease D [Alphaproteobacteria bacterium]|nr:ribonuclease D [Alphaproteobacteria bacterium]